MVLAERVQPQHDPGSVGRRVGLVTCSNCRVLMPRISLRPSDEQTFMMRSTAVPSARPKRGAG